MPRGLELRLRWTWKHHPEQWLPNLQSWAAAAASLHPAPALTSRSALVLLTFPQPVLPAAGPYYNHCPEGFTLLPSSRKLGSLKGSLLLGGGWVLKLATGFYLFVFFFEIGSPRRGWPQNGVSLRLWSFPFSFFILISYCFARPKSIWGSHLLKTDLDKSPPRAFETHIQSSIWEAHIEGFRRWCVSMWWLAHR